MPAFVFITSSFPISCVFRKMDRVKQDWIRIEENRICPETKSQNGMIITRCSDYLILLSSCKTVGLFIAYDCSIGILPFLRYLINRDASLLNKEHSECVDASKTDFILSVCGQATHPPGQMILR